MSVKCYLIRASALASNLVDGGFKGKGYNHILFEKQIIDIVVNR